MRQDLCSQLRSRSILCRWGRCVGQSCDDIEDDNDNDDQVSRLPVQVRGLGPAQWRVGPALDQARQSRPGHRQVRDGRVQDNGR